MDGQCDYCGKQGARFTLGILKDPQFCNRKCMHSWVVENIDEVIGYIEDVMTTEES